MQAQRRQFGQQAGGLGIVAADDARRVAGVRVVALRVEPGVQLGVCLRPVGFPLGGLRFGELAQEHQRGFHRGVAGAERPTTRKAW